MCVFNPPSPAFVNKSVKRPGQTSSLWGTGALLVFTLGRQSVNFAAAYLGNRTTYYQGAEYTGSRLVYTWASGTAPPPRRRRRLARTFLSARGFYIYGTIFRSVCECIYAGFLVLGRAVVMLARPRLDEFLCTGFPLTPPSVIHNTMYRPAKPTSNSKCLGGIVIA